jgi:hypothetical protein
MRVLLLKVFYKKIWNFYLPFVVTLRRNLGFFLRIFAGKTTNFGTLIKKDKCHTCIFDSLQWVLLVFLCL